jgi:hypothetical protein
MIDSIKFSADLGKAMSLALKSPLSMYYYLFLDW